MSIIKKGSPQAKLKNEDKEIADLKYRIERYKGERAPISVAEGLSEAINIGRPRAPPSRLRESAAADEVADGRA